MAEEDEFERFVLDNTRSARRYLLALTRDRALAEDLLQEAFLRAWRYWETFRGDANRQAWLIGICRNVAFSHLRKTLRRREADGLAAPSTDRILSIETRDLLLELPLEYREVLLLVEVLGYDYSTTAEILDRPIGTVRSRLNRARSELRKIANDSSGRSRHSA